MKHGGYRLCLCLSMGVFSELSKISNTPSPDKNEQVFVSVCVLVLIRAVSGEDVCVVLVVYVCFVQSAAGVRRLNIILKSHS